MIARLVALAGGGRALRVAPPDRPTALAAGFVAAALAFLASFALALALAGLRLERTWTGPEAGVATLQVVAEQDAVEPQARAALEVLRTTPGVQSVRLVKVEEQRALLAPWLGADLAVDDLPLPLLIEVAADRDTLDRGALDARLAAEAPGAVYDDHAGWRLPLAGAAERAAVFGFAALGLLAAVMAAVIGLAAAGAVANNAGAVRTLRLVGARDRFISAAFTRRFARLAAASAAAGAALAAATLALLPSDSEAGFFLVAIAPAGWGWAALALVPLAAGAVAWGAARLAARRALRRWA